MGADRYTIARQLAHRITQPFPALNLDHLRTRLHQLRRAVQGLLRGGAGHERKVGDDKGAVVSALYAGSVINHIFQPDRQGAVMALQDHPQRIADEEHLNARRAQCMCKCCVVAGEHGDLFTALLEVFQVCQSD